MEGGPGPLRIPAFRRLLSAYVVNQTGDSIALVALSVLVYDKSGSALATAALFIAAKFVPAFVAPALIARVDQLPRNRVLPAVYLTEALLFGLLALAALHYVLPVVLGLALLDGVLAVAARGLVRGAVADLLEPAGRLRDGNAVLNVFFSGAVVLGTAFGGLIVAGLTPSGALAIDAVSFAAAALLVVRVPGGVRADGGREPFGQRLRAGLVHVRVDPVLRVLMAGQALGFVFFTLVIPIEVIYAKASLDAGDGGYGALLAAWSAGMLGGSLLYVRRRQVRLVAIVVGSTAAIGLAYIGLALADRLWLACALSVFGGVGNAFQWVGVLTLLQEATPPDLQARVSGLLESVGAAMPAVGYALGGALTVIGSPRTAYAVAGAGVLGVALLAGVLLPTRVRPPAAASPG